MKEVDCIGCYSKNDYMMFGPVTIIVVFRPVRTEYIAKGITFLFLDPLVAFMLDDL